MRCIDYLFYTLTGTIVASSDFMYDLPLAVHHYTMVPFITAQWSQTNDALTISADCGLKQK